MNHSTHSVPTTLRYAFESIQVKRIVDNAAAKRIAGAIMDNLGSNNGTYKRPDVHINVTTPTFKQLVKEGVL